MTNQEMAEFMAEQEEIYRKQCEEQCEMMVAFHEQQSKPKKLQIKTRAVGVSFGDAQKNIAAWTPSKAVRFVYEKDNPHDPFAIKIVLNGSNKLLGYLPKDLAKWIRTNNKMFHIIWTRRVGSEDTNYGLRFVLEEIPNAMEAYGRDA